jgi:hypothetical protein
MGMKYFPNCKEMLVAKALGSYSQVGLKGVCASQETEICESGGRWWMRS